MEATSQIYLEITLEGGGLVSGESDVGGYENRIGIDSFQFDATAEKDTLKDVEGGVTANLLVKSISVTKVFDRASLLLAGVLSRHQKFSKAKIAIDQQYIAEGDKERNEILIMYLRDGYVADINIQTSESNFAAAIKETITLSFHEIEMYYYAEDRSKSGSDAGKLGDDYRWEPVPFRTERKVQGI